MLLDFIIPTLIFTGRVVSLTAGIACLMTMVVLIIIEVQDAYRDWKYDKQTDTLFKNIEEFRSDFAHDKKTNSKASA